MWCLEINELGEDQSTSSPQATQREARPKELKGIEKKRGLHAFLVDSSSDEEESREDANDAHTRASKEVYVHYYSHEL